MRRVRRRLRLRTRLRDLLYLAEAGLPAIRAGWWATQALARLRQDIQTDGLDVRVLKPPSTRPMAVRGVETALRLRRATCLERSLIVQRWLMAYGSPHEVLVGVTRGSESMEAHAWIYSYDSEAEGEGFRVLTRVAPRQ